MAKIVKKYSKTTLVLGLLFVLVLMYSVIPAGQTATVTPRQDTLSDSRPTPVKSNHDVQFTTDAADGIAEGETVVVDFGGASDVFNLTGVVLGDVDFEVGGVDANLVAAASCGVPANEFETVISAVNDNITFTRCAGDGAVAGGSTINVKVGTNADGGANQITNPAVGVYDVTVAGTFQTAEVTSTIKVAIVAGVGVTATVAESLTFTISSVAAASCPETIGGTDRSDQAGHDDDSIPFGSINPSTFYFSCQSLAISTNAGGGYSGTVQETDQLKTAGATEFPDGDCDTNCSEISNGTWTGAANDGFGYCMDDVTGNGAQTAGWATAEQCDDATPEFMIFPEKGIDAPDVQTIMSSAGAVADTSYVGYKINPAATQTAGDYSNTTIYVVTPTY